MPASSGRAIREPDLVACGTRNRAARRSLGGLALARGVDNADGRPESLLDIQSRWYRASARRGAAPAGRSLRPESRASRRADSASTSSKVTSSPRPRELAEAAPGALLRRGGDEDLHVGVGADRPCRCRARRARRRPACRGEGALAVRPARRAPPGCAADHRGGLARLAAAQARLVEIARGPAPARRARRPPRRRADRSTSISARGRRRDRAGRYRDAAGRNARRAAWRACPCPRPPGRRSR